MKRRAMFAGLWGGLLLVIAGLYPALGVFTPAFVAGWPSPVVNPVAHAMLLMFSAVLGFVALFVPTLSAVVQSRERGFRANAMLGAVTGAFSGILFYLFIIQPLNSLRGWELLQPALWPRIVEDPIAIGSYARHIFEVGNVAMLWTVGIAIGWCALLGGVFGWGRFRHFRETPALTLREAMQKDRTREWLQQVDKDESTKVALWVGVVVGMLGVIVNYQGVWELGALWPELGGILDTALHGEAIVRSLMVISPLWGIMLVCMGGVVVALIKNPTSQFWARGWAVIVSVTTAFLISYVQSSLNTTFFVGLSPFLLPRLVAQSPDFPLPSSFYDVLPGLVQALASPELQVPLHFIFPAVVCVLGSLAVTAVSLASGLVYVPLVIVFSPRPVDRAARWRWAWRRQGHDQFFSMLYHLFTVDTCAYDVLAHLAIGLQRHRQHRDTALLLAAYHSLGTASVDYSALSREIAQAIEKHPERRYAAELASSFYSLSEVLAADSLPALLHLAPPQIHDTTSIPPLLVRAIQRMVGVIQELVKTTQVEDLPTKVTFLNNALETLAAAQRVVDGDMRDHHQSATPYPEQPALSFALARWENLIMLMVKKLKGRADVGVTLKTLRTTAAARLPVVLAVHNRGLNVAERVRLRLLPGPDYHLSDDLALCTSVLGILPAGEQGETTLYIEPKPEAKRIRLEWEVTYDDSVEAGRQARAGDVMEFVAPDKPFQRVFPIPYVTGTPLKTGEVFVGRQDIFEFVKENLLGAHQNNVIILHGQRRTGKTSVLYRLGEALRATHVAVLIDMQGKPARGTADFLYAIADDIVYALEQQGVAAPLPERREFDEAPEFFFRSRFIRSLYPALGERNLLLLFDEFEELQSRVEDGRLEPEIFQFLRNLMQHESRMDFVFSGTHKLEELGSGYWSALFNIAVYKRITFLAPAEMRRLMTEPIAQYPVEYDPLAVDKVLALTAGHPYFTQLLLHELMVYYNENQRTYLTVTDVEQSMGRVLERGEAHFKYIWTESTPAEQLVMRLLAEMSVSRAATTLHDLKMFGEKFGHAVGEAEVTALAQLENRDILTRSDQRYRYTVPLIAKWVQRSFPLMG